MSTVACTVGEKREVVGQTGEVPAPEEGRVLAAEAHAPAVTSEARAANFQRNLDAMVAVLKRGYKHPDQERVGLELERVLRDETGKRVVYPGPAGFSAMLHKFMELHPDCTPRPHRRVSHGLLVHLRRGHRKGRGGRRVLHRCRLARAGRAGGGFRRPRRQPRQHAGGLRRV